MFKKNSDLSAASGKMESVLGANTSYHGTIKSDGNLRIDGVVEGRVETAGNVIVGPSAKVLADIVANAVQVWGAVRGNVTAQGRLEILPTGRVWGDIRVASLLIDEGGVFRGQCVMAGEEVEAAEMPPLALDEPRPRQPQPAATQSDDAADVAPAAQAAGTATPQEAWTLPSLQRMRDAVAESAARVAVVRANWREEASGQ